MELFYTIPRTRFARRPPPSAANVGGGLGKAVGSIAVERRSGTRVMEVTQSWAASNRMDFSMRNQRLIAVGILLGCLSAGWSQQGWVYVTTVSLDASEGETILHVTEEGVVQEGRSVLVRTRDGSRQDAYEVLHVLDGYHVILGERLKRDYLAGSAVYQQGP